MYSYRRGRIRPRSHARAIRPVRGQGSSDKPDSIAHHHVFKPRHNVQPRRRRRYRSCGSARYRLPNGRVYGANTTTPTPPAPTTDLRRTGRRAAGRPGAGHPQVADRGSRRRCGPVHRTRTVARRPRPVRSAPRRIPHARPGCELPLLLLRRHALTTSPTTGPTVAPAASTAGPTTAGQAGGQRLPWRSSGRRSGSGVSRTGPARPTACSSRV